MSGHTSSYLDAIECGYCHNVLPSGDASTSLSGAACCSKTCALLAEEATSVSALGPVVCTNCERACQDTHRIVFSEDGLPFCGEECAARYPKMVGAPEVKRVLCTAAAGMFLAAGLALLGIAVNLSALTRHP